MKISSFKIVSRIPGPEDYAFTEVSAEITLEKGETMGQAIEKYRDSLNDADEKTSKKQNPKVEEEDEVLDEEEENSDEASDESVDESETEEIDEESVDEEVEEEEAPKSVKKAATSAKKTTKTASASPSEKKFKKKPQAYSRSNEQHKELFSGILKAVSPKWKDAPQTKERAKKVSQRMEGKEFLDENGEVLASFKVTVKALMNPKK